MVKFFIAIICILIANAAYAQKITEHPNYAEISKQLDTLIIETSKKQTTYFETYKRYYQGLEIPTAECDGVTAKPAEITKKPTDQAVSWEQFDPDLYKTTTTLLFKTYIDTYKAPTGYGWMLTAKLKYDDITWMYRYHDGPEDFSLSTVFDKWVVYVPLADDVAPYKVEP